MNDVKYLLSAIEGYKTYIVAVAAIIYGAYVKDAQIILLGLGLVGIRRGISTEVAKVLTSVTPVATAKAEAPVIAAEAVTAAVDAASQAVVEPTPVAETTPVAQ